jgi:acetylornithine deacetylase
VVDGGAHAGESLLGHVLACRGLPPGPLRAPYCCDLRHLVNQGGMPGLIFGPGSIAEAHRPNESIGLREYLTSIEVLIDFVCAWCRSAAPDTYQEREQ